MNPNLVVAALAALPVLLLPVILNAETRDVSPRDPLTLEAAVELALDAEEPTLRRLEARAEAIEVTAANSKAMFTEEQISEKLAALAAAAQQPDLGHERPPGGPFRVP